LIRGNVVAGRLIPNGNIESRMAPLTEQEFQDIRDQIEAGFVTLKRLDKKHEPESKADRRFRTATRVEWGQEAERINDLMGFEERVRREAQAEWNDAAMPVFLQVKFVAERTGYYEELCFNTGGSTAGLGKLWTSVEEWARLKVRP